MIKMGKRKFNTLKYGSLSIALVLIVIAIAVFINLLITKYNVKWDLTPNKIYSLDDTTKDLIKKIDKDVIIYGLFDNGKVPNDPNGSPYMAYQAATELLDQYKELSSKITVKYIDPDAHPDIMTELDPNGETGLQKGDFVVVCGKKSRPVLQSELQSTYQSQETDYGEEQGTTTDYLTAELNLTSAIKIVTADKTPVVYFTQGHQEGSYESEFKLMGDLIKNDGYDTKGINLLSSDKVPDDAECLIVVGPKRDLAPDETGKINDYLNKGGKAMFLFDPVVPNENMSEFEKVISDYGVALNYDRVKETDSTRYATGKSNDIIVAPEVNEINSSLNSADYSMVMQNSRSLNLLKTQKVGLTVTPLVKTSNKAIGEQIDKSKGNNLSGPLTLAVASEYSSIGSKVVVMGSASFLSDQNCRDYNGISMYFFINAKGWLLDKKEDVSISPKSLEAQKLNIDQGKVSVTGIILVFVIPVLIFAIGTVVWMRRRHL